MADDTAQTVVCSILAVMTIMWLPYVIADFALLEAVGTEFGIMLGTLLFLLGGYDLAETAGVVEYP